MFHTNLSHKRFLTDLKTHHNEDNYAMSLQYGHLISIYVITARKTSSHKKLLDSTTKNFKFISLNTAVGRWISNTWALIDLKEDKRSVIGHLLSDKYNPFSIEIIFHQILHVVLQHRCKVDVQTTAELLTVTKGGIFTSMKIISNNTIDLRKLVNYKKACSRTIGTIPFNEIF